ncbi:hypothetical protein KP509_34G001400 [Ceratopteris richardii]|uniref:Uncharacterized protein n=1 Tax=Ceratopteris richardii TaxID=49495 RepID=A0A8T2QIV1_CERRI|nr:hypothetical protein KP509_34G001400 [Ceratopteris richardii]
MATPPAASRQQRTPVPPKSSRATPAKNRRRLARGPRSGEQPPSPAARPLAALGGCAVGQRAPASASTPPAPQVEDHRVVSTHFHDGATQAIMKVTILAAGFVIGARGISARLIGQVTGAVAAAGGGCRPPQFSQLPPVRLFRIEGKRGSAVAKYNELCQCKRRGEFVQREHLIGGVEFYYHPPPRKALMPSSPPRSSPPSPPICKLSKPPMSFNSSLPTRSSASAGYPHAWKNNVVAASAPRPPSPPRTQRLPFLSLHLQPPAPPPLPESLLCSGGSSSSSSPVPPIPPAHLLPNFRSAPASSPQVAATKIFNACGRESTNGLTSLEQSIDRIGPRAQQPEDINAQSNSRKQLSMQCKEHQPPIQPRHGGAVVQQQTMQQYCSLFSVFGNGGLPLPIAQVAITSMQQKDSHSSHKMSGSPQQLQAASNAFEFTACDFLRESLPLPPFAAATSGRGDAFLSAHRPSLPPSAAPEYCLFGQPKLLQSCPVMPLQQQFYSSVSLPSSSPTTPLPAPPGPPTSQLLNPISAVAPDLIQWPPLIRSSAANLHEPRKP